MQLVTTAMLTKAMALQAELANLIAATAVCGVGEELALPTHPQSNP